MKISIDWLKDFVDIKETDAKKISLALTMATAEVDEVIGTPIWKKEVKVVKVLSKEKHPEADKLNLVTFDLGNNQIKKVVCGAPNVRENIKVFFAPIGIELPGGLKLEAKKIRGILSEGMLCSKVELGVGDDHSGLWELPQDTKIGISFSEFMNEKDDIILDIDNKSLTHRPDLWGHFGMAREFGCIYKENLKNRFDKEWEQNLEKKFTDQKSPILPKVEKDSACKIYMGLSLDNVSIAPSPEYIQNRLRQVGLRPINNLVDIGNYVMLELGIPLHIFDRDLIKGSEIIIKRNGKDENFKTLDDIERKILANDTMICDAKEPLVIAGIMGGASSAVSDKTKNVFIEVANWNPSEVRKTSVRLGLRTDSSMRYEKALDSTLCKRTLLRACELLLELCPNAKVVGKIEVAGEDINLRPNLVIKTSAENISSVLGYTVDQSLVIDILTRLAFKVTNLSDNILNIEVPSFRATKDVECEADLIEEIGRMIGFDNITPYPPTREILPTNLSSLKKFHRKIQDFMVLNAKSFEVMTYPLIGKDLLEMANWPILNDKLCLINSLSLESDRMRPSLIPSALEKIALNAKNYPSFSFFELGRSYIANNDFSEEHNQLIFVHYSRKDNVFMNVANSMEELLNYLALPFEFSKELNSKFDNPVMPINWKGRHPNEFLNIKVMGKYVGAISSISPLVMKNFKLKGNVAIALIDLFGLENKSLAKKIKYTQLPRFPSVNFDCTVLAKQQDNVADILNVFKKMSSKEIIDKKIIDVFQLNETIKCVTIRSTFFDKERTLTPEEIKVLENTVISFLDKAGFKLKT